MRYFVIVIDPDDGRALLLPNESAWTVPSFITSVTDIRLTDHINDEMARQIGSEVMTLRCARHGQDDDGQPWRIYIAECSKPHAVLSAGAKWMNRDGLQKVVLSSPVIRGALERWFAEWDAPPERRSPWAIPHWRSDAVEWIHSELQRLGMPARSPVRQLRAWALSCTMRVSTDEGNVYFKATPSFMAHEGIVMREAAARYPTLVPSPLAVDSQRGWLLMRDFGDDMLHTTPDVRLWEDALHRYAQVQVEQAAHTDEWLALGCPDRRLGRMVELIDPFVTVSSHMLAHSPNSLSDEELEGIRAIAMKLKMLCANLAGYNVPHTLVHGDLGGNIALSDDGYVFFDWTDACVSHPFFDMTTIVQTAFDVSALKNNVGVRNRLRDAYLQAWTGYESMERLVHGFELSRSLGVLHQAMSYMWILMNIAEDARWELEGGLVMWLRNLLKVLPPGK